MNARQIIETLGMERHPEGGWFKETFRDTDQHDGRAISTASRMTSFRLTAALGASLRIRV